MTRADQIYRRFRAFHKANPQVWDLFQQFTNELIAQGYKRYSVDAVLHRVRWEVAIKTRGDEGVKLNNDFTPYYARMWLATHPQWPNFFELRARKSLQRPASAEDIAVQIAPAPGAEQQLTQELQWLASAC